MAIRLFLDEDVGFELARQLRTLGTFDVLTTAEAGRASLGYTDEDQLTFATSVDRALFSFNAKHYDPLARHWAAEARRHAGILLSRQAPASMLVAGFVALAKSYPDGLPANVCMYLPSV